MSGSPSEAEIQTQWRNAVDLLEQTRAFADGSVAGAGNLLDVLMQSLEGEYTPVALAGAAQRFRAQLAALVEPGMAASFLQPLVFEYGKVLTDGAGYTDVGRLMRALYEHFIANTLSVKSRAITFDTTATAGGSNVGNGACARLTVDENGFPLEFCHVETKRLRCRRDQNNGAKEHAEEFEVLGDAASPDALLRAAFGSGTRANRTLIARHAGSGNGGSLLRNGSFSTYSASATPKFQGWTEVAGGAQIAQDTTNVYRGYPNQTVAGSLRINGGGGTVTLRQPLSSMARQQIDSRQPYFLRVMLNKTIGTAVGGSVTIRMGAASVTSTIAALGANWVELAIPFTSDCWPKQFNEADFAIEIEWSSSTSGYLLVDDVLFCPWDLVDGTYWLIRANAATPVAWLVDDTLEFTDTGGDPATGKVQWWLFVAGLGYLPSSGSPTFTDP